MSIAHKPLDPEANRVIDALGGTAEVARLCDVNMQAVSQWRRNGLPRVQRRLLAVLHPELFPEPAREAAA